MAEGEFALVRKYLENALPLTASWVGEHDLYAMLADTAAEQRDAEALAQYAPLAEELAVRYDHKLYRAIAHRAWGVAYRLAGQYDESAAHLHQALEIFHALSTRWQIGRTLFELGELASARNEGTAALEYFTRALAAFEQISALPDAAHTRERIGHL